MRPEHPRKPKTVIDEVEPIAQFHSVLRGASTFASVSSIVALCRVTDFLIGS